MEIPEKMFQQFMNNKLSKTDYRVMLWLISNPEPTNTGTIADAVGVKPKAVNKSLRRLIDAGLVEQGQLETRKRIFVIPGIERCAPMPEPLGTTDARISAIEDTLKMLIGTVENLYGMIEAMKKSNFCPDTDHKSPEMPQRPPETAPPEPTDGVKAEPPNIKKQAAAMLLNNSSSLHEFRALFGVDVPIGADQMAVAEMIRRRKAGKLDNVKSPLAYLSSISGKVTAPAPAVINVPVYAPVVDNDLEIRACINQLWARMTDEEIKPYRQKAMEKHQASGHKKVAIELLTRQVFNNEQMSMMGISI